MGNKQTRTQVLASSRSGLDSPTLSYRSEGGLNRKSESRSGSPVIRKHNSTININEVVNDGKNGVKFRSSSVCIDRRNSRERKSLGVSPASQDIGKRVYMRAAQKRESFADFCDHLSREQCNEMVDKMKEYLDKVVAKVGKESEIQRLSEEFGEWHVLLRPLGFKPDFFAAAAEAVTTECVFLDQAAHPPTEAFLAWAELITMMFTSVRNGYYAEVRRQRKQSSLYGNGKNSLDSADGSEEGTTETNNHLSVVREESVDTTSCNGVEKTRL